MIKADPKLVGDISVLGLSQGALVARSVIETCDFNGTVSGVFPSSGGVPEGRGGIVLMLLLMHWYTLRGYRILLARLDISIILKSRQNI